jgi:hypothetical protein
MLTNVIGSAAMTCLSQSRPDVASSIGRCHWLSRHPSRRMRVGHRIQTATPSRLVHLEVTRCHKAVPYVALSIGRCHWLSRHPSRRMREGHRLQTATPSQLVHLEVTICPKAHAPFGHSGSPTHFDTYASTTFNGPTCRLHLDQ